MNILADINSLLEGLGVRIETGVFSDVAPEEYVVITPLSDSFELFGDDLPGFETQEARLSLYSQGNYLALKSRIVRAFLDAGFTISDRWYLGHEDDTGYHHYAIDLAKLYRLEE